MSAIHLRLLGQPSLDGPTGSSPLQPTKPNAVACYLAAQVGSMIPRSRIIATFWEGLPEPDGRRSLSTTLVRLRRSLPEWPVLSEGDLLGWDPNAAIVVDTSLLAGLARENGSRTDQLRAAVAEPLWRGPFLQDFHLPDAPAFDQWLHAQRQHWEEQYLNLLHRLITTEAASGLWDAVATHARQALQVDPLQERFHRVLMEALGRGGDRSAALAQYAALQRLLREDLGVEPDQQTTLLRNAILANEIGPAGSSATHPGSVESPAHPDLGQSPELPRQFHLPNPSTKFIGRQVDIAAVKEKFPTTRLLTLTGPGGVGKTRLSLQVAADLLPTRADGVWFVDLAALTDPELVPAVVASTFGLNEQPDRPSLDVLVAHLQSKQMLLVLDNCEHLVEACAALSDRLLQFCAQLWILATSREALGIAGEVVWQVAPFPEPDAITLFIDRATAVVPSFAPTTQDDVTIARICRRLDGIALAIELAAVLVRVLSVDEIDARLRDRFALLNAGSRTASDRQKTLRGAVDWSHDLLSEAERALLRRLSVFAGGFTLAAAEHICAGGDLPPDQVLSRLRQLVDKSLVIAEGHGRERRFCLLETIRQYALEKLQDAAEWHETCARHFDWFARLAQKAAAEQFGPARGAGYAWFDRELDNLRAALDWNRSVPGAMVKSVRLAWLLAHYWHARGHLREGRERVAQLLDPAGAALDPALEAEKCTLRAYLAIMHSDFADVVAPAERGLALWRELGSKQGMSRCLLCLGLAAYHTDEVDRAVTLLEDALTLGRVVNADPDLRLFLYYLAEAVAAEGDLKRARSLHEEVVAISRAKGGVFVPTTLMRLARLAALDGDWTQAEVLERESLSLWDPTFKGGTAMAFDEVCLMAAQRGQMQRAVCIGGAADAIRRFLDGRELQEWEAAPRTSRAEITVRATGITSNRGRRADVADALDKARSALGDLAFAQAWSRGQSLSPEQALAYARSEPVGV